ncbi:MAG: immunoglobulin-like domain-containing protein [Mycoplasmatales bacterium]
MKKFFIFTCLTIATFFTVSTVTTTAISASETTQNTRATSINNIVIFIDFNDTNSFNGDETKARQIESVYNDFLDTNGDGLSDNDMLSVKSYMYDVTKGNTTLNSHFYPKSTTTNGYSAFKATMNKSEYSKIVIGSNSEKDFLSEVFNGVKDQIELSETELDQDNDGRIDGVSFIFSGLPGSGNSMLRPHKTEMTTNNPTLKGKRLSAYNILAEGSANVNIYNKRFLSTMVHEYLHMLGYPDLYRDGQNTSPVGIWDIMGDTVTTPQLPLVYSRNIYGGTPLGIQEISTSGTYTLKTSSITNNTDPVAFKIKSKEYPNEYFMIEYRKNDKKWDGATLPGSGLVVYRINDNIRAQSGNNTNNGNHIYVFRPGETAPNSGGGRIREAFYSENAARPSIGSPIASGGFNSESIYFADGINSGIEIKEIGNSNSDEISFRIELPLNDITGDGSVADPFQIKNSRDLNLLRTQPDKNFILVNDIDLTNEKLTPIDEFSGTFDGKGNKISNMSLVSDPDTTAFINSLADTGVIKNISFENVDVDATSWISSTVVGMNLGVVDNVKVSGVLQANSGGSIGGIIGDNRFGTVTNSTSNLKITSGLNQNVLVGGVVGNAYNKSSQNNYFSGTITSQPNNKVGAVFGRMVIDALNLDQASIDNLWNKTTSGLTKGVGETLVTDQSITLPDSEKGVVSIEVLDNITLNVDVNPLSDELVIYNKALQNFRETFTSSDQTIVTIDARKAKAIAGGTAKITFNLMVGTNEINEEIAVSVSSSLNELPEIFADDVKLKVGDVFDPLKSVTATDKEDGNLTSKIKIVENTVDTSKVGTYKVVYEVEDSAGAKVTKEISVQVDLTIVSVNNVPKIFANDVILKVGDLFDPLKSVTATDKEDGDLTSQIKIVENTVNTLQAGTYKVVYEVQDNDGAKVTKEISVKINLPIVSVNNVPEIFANDAKIRVGDIFDPFKFVTATDKEDGNLTSQIKVIENTVDTTTAGTYKVVYEVQDSKASKATKNINVVVVTSLVIDNTSNPIEIVEYLKRTIENEIEVKVTKNDRVIDKSIFKSLMETGKRIRFTQDDGSVWTFDGKDINNNDIQNITIRTGNETSENTMQSIFKFDPNAKILHFDYHGQLPGKASVKMKVDNPANLMNKDLTLYYYNANTNKPEKIQNSVFIDEDGFVTIEITHCSDYFLSVDKTLADVKNPTDDKVDGPNVENTGTILINKNIIVVVLFLIALLLGRKFLIKKDRV